MFAQEIAWAPSIWFSLTSCLTATVTYLILVPLRKNPGAKRLVFLLAVCLALLTMTLMRIYFGDYDGRYEVITGTFILLGLAFIYLAISMYVDQRRGARRRREALHSSKE